MSQNDKTIKSIYIKNVEKLQEANSSNNRKKVDEVLKLPLYQAAKSDFIEFATTQLQSKKLTFTREVYLNYQLMRYYVAVEADFDKSFFYLVHLLKILEGKEEYVMYPAVIGDAYFIAYWIKQIQYDLIKAEEYANLLVDHATHFEMNKLLIKAKMGLAELNQHNGNVKEAILQFRAIEKEITEANDSIQLNRIHLLLSNAYTVNENVDSAFFHAKKAYKIVPLENVQLKAFSTIQLARGYLEQNEVKKAIELGKEALAVVEKLETKKEIKDINQFLADAHKSNANYKQALFHLENFMKLDQEQASLLSAANISNLESKMSDDKHDYLLNLKQAKVDKQEMEIDLKNKQTIGLIVFLAFAIGLIIVTVRSYIMKKRDAETILQQKMIVEEAHQEIKDSITYAKRIQSAILPPNKVVKEYLKESFILYKPKDVVAGDFYWMEHKANKVLFAAADCTGHGVPGAMVSVVCNNALNRSVREHGLSNPGQILDKTREIVIAEFEKSEEDVKDGMDIALCSLEGNKLQYAGAHNPLWIIRDGAIIETKANKQPIGQFDSPEPYTTHDFDLEQGDSIYIFSDGYVDQFGGEKGKKFKARAFRELLLSIQDKTMEEQKVIIDDSFETWRGDLEQIDDVCIIGVQV